MSQPDVPADRKPFRSKVTLKGLPPSITEEHARSLLSEHLQACRSVIFIPGRPPNRNNPYAKAHPASVILDFVGPEALLKFSEKWQGRDCKEGDRHYATTIEFSPLQGRHVRYDSLRARQAAEARRAQLGQLPAFRTFLETEFEGNLKTHTEKSFLTAEKQSAELREGETRLRPWLVDPELAKRTPLLEHLETHRRKFSTAKKNNGTDRKKKKKKKKGSDDKATVGNELEHREQNNKVDLPSGFYIDRSPSTPNVETTSASRKNRKNNTVDELKIYDMALEDKPSSVLLPANPPAKAFSLSKLKAQSESSAKPGVRVENGPGRTNFEPKPKLRIATRPSDAPPRRSGPQPPQQLPDPPPKKSFSLKSLKAQSTVTK